MHPQEGKLHPSVYQQADGRSCIRLALVSQLKLITSDAADVVYAHGKIWFIWSWLALQGGQSACVCKEQLCKPMQS